MLTDTLQQKARPWLHRLDNGRARLFDAERLSQAEQTPYDTLFDDGLVKLRYYPPLQEKAIPLSDGTVMPVSEHTQRTPLVLVAPLAVNMLIYDLFPQRSLVRYLRARGFELYMVDWGRPGKYHNHLSLSSYFADYLPKMLVQVRQHSGQQQLSLHGWSFGGLFSLCYTALGNDPDIRNLVLVGTPCDYHRNGALGAQYRRLSRQAKWIRSNTGLRIHDVPARLLRSPGWMNSLAFKLTNPVGSLQGYMNLVRNLHDREFVAAHATNGAFLDDMVAYPGGVIQDIVRYLWTDNVVAHGQLPMASSEGNLSRVTANILNITGGADPIVTRDCSLAMDTLVRSKDKTYLTIDGGHMGILGSSAAQTQSWGRIAEWLIERD
ncbi:MAG: alpha/beta fold hydrolase [Pseudomonadales bacterium]|uniref:alpha/beta fold hydrolase n=1 Tax=Alcanivorax sp. MD8A TaxID=1177157 RepID=UPI000C9A5AFE|nr:alpha/beta fold hydrolase [Alcanivorax sp. MD8A]MCG8437453.1 alpha/beta fold hydrolase [Pseudomonadales bacterium]MED5431515.1 alpha/beta fold hydrolase [Pseudomonadota bacterium]MEE2870521.1 alpha/beta fold hydrolase [Pseudomonadota bacterium]PNE03582.1 polyhydroxyalkanoate synthase [Alcanivorax sp. MD8A]